MQPGKVTRLAFAFANIDRIRNATQFFPRSRDADTDPNLNPQALQLGLGAWGVIAAQFVLIPDRFMDDMFDQPRPTNHARLVCRVAGTGIFTAIAALMELKNTGNVKKARKIFAVGNTAALFLGPQTAERELKGHCTKKHIIPHLALGPNGLALAATLL